MKYLSVVVLVGLMTWTWRLVHRESAISQQIHVGIQQDLRRIITDYIQKNLPNSEDLRFERFWTEALSKDKVKAAFLYSFKENSQSHGPTRVQIDGYAILNRDKNDSNAEKESWSFDELYILNNQIEFQQPLTITPQVDEETDSE